jgi:hypothetical protein
MDTTTGLKEQIQEKYGAAARLAASVRKDASCCSGTSCCGAEEITENLYSDGERGTLPDAAVAASLGCGNPTALIELKAGENRARSRIGRRHRRPAVGATRRSDRQGLRLDMTDDMLALARAEPAQGRRRQRRVPQRARSNRSRCPTARWTSSSPTV